MTRLVALLLTTATGFSGLVYEVAWERYLGTLLGAHSEATAAVLGIFLGGLSVGYWLFGVVTRRLVERAERNGVPPRLLFTYGLVEGGIGVYVILFPFLFSAVQAISVLGPQSSAAASFAFDVSLAAVLIGPPTILMGGTIPILTQALARSMDDATRFHALVYAFNTAGAFAGALAAGFVLIPQLGLERVMMTMGAINITVGIVFVLLDRGRASGMLNPESPDGSAAKPRAFAVLALVALLVGFAMMAIQTVVIRLGSFAFGSSQFTFSMVVAVFVLCIALGSFLVSALRRIHPAVLIVNQWALVAVLVYLYTRVDEAPFWAHVLRARFGVADADFLPFYLAAFAAILVVLGVPVLLSGATLPLLFHHLRNTIGDLGASAGRLYSWNTVGSLLGALLGGYAFLFVFDLHDVYRIAIAALVVAATLVTALIMPAARVAVGVLLVFVLGLLVILEPWDPNLLSSGLYRMRNRQANTREGPDHYVAERMKHTRVLTHDDDPIASITVTQQGSARDNISIRTNGKSDGSTRADYETMALIGQVSALFAHEPRRAFVIGWGTGISAGELLALDSIEEVVVAEISPAVMEAAPRFDFANLDASKSPKLRVVRSDAYRALLRDSSRYDVIASEPSNPWVTGVEMLYSREFLEVARSRLSPGGVFAQWIHQYEIDRKTIELVLRTYAQVFDHVAVWYLMGADLLLLGFENEAQALDLEHIEAQFNRPDFRAGFERSGIRSMSALLAHELMPVGVINDWVASSEQGPIHTLTHPRLSYQAGRAFFRGGRGVLPFTGGGSAARHGMERSLMRKYAERFGGRVPDEARAEAVNESCKYRRWACAPLVAQWMQEDPDSPEWERAFVGALVRRPQVGAVIDRPLLARLAPLYQESLVPARTSVNQAAMATRDYVQFYNHAAPFSSASLMAFWENCDAPGEKRACRNGRNGVRDLLGATAPR